MIRLVLRILEESSAGHVKLALYVNGEQVSGPCGITLRTSELVAFIERVRPEHVSVDREMVSAYLVALLGPLERGNAFIRYV